jgi:hypothetical protein
MELKRIEHNLITAVAITAPWLAPAIPAYFAVHNAQRYLTFGDGWTDTAFVWIVGLAVEFVGLASVHTAVEFWTWNDEKRKSDNPAPFWVALGAVVFYVTVVLTVNAVLELTQGLTVIVFARAALSLLSVNAAIIIGLRAQHARRRAEIDEQKTAKKTGQMSAEKPVKSGQMSGQMSVAVADWRRARHQLSDAELSELAQMRTGDIQSRYGLDERTARRWRDNANQLKETK